MMTKTPSMTTKIFNALTMVDFFQQNVSLKLEEKNRVSMKIGRVFSFTIVIFLVYNFFSSDMIQKLNPMILQQNLELNNRKEINFSEENFVFSMAIASFNNTIFQDPSIFTFSLLQSNVKNGTIYTNKEKASVSCTADDFKRFPGYFQGQNLNGSTCLKEKEFSIKGYWDEPELDFFQIEVHACKNSSNNSVICKPQEEIENFFADKYFNIWIEQKFFDFTSFDEPIMKKINNYFRGLEKGQTKIMRLFMTKTSIITDTASAYSDFQTIDSYRHNRIEYDSTFSNEVLFRLVLYSDQTYVVYNRRYQKLFDLLALLGGILNALVLIFGFIVKYFYNLSIIRLIFKKLFFIQERPSLYNMEKENLIRSHFLRSIKKISPKMKKSNVNDWRKKGLTLWENIKFFFFKFGLPDPNIKKKILFKEILRLCNRKIDLIEILKKIEEIDKIKLVLFSKEQISLFDSLQKKKIDHNNLKEISEMDKYALNLNDINGEEINNLEKYLREIKQKINPTEMEKRFISIIY